MARSSRRDRCGSSNQATAETRPAPPERFAPGLEALLRPIGELSEDPKNARRHGDRSLDAIRASLERFGQRKPIVARGGKVIAGNGTLRVARALGWSRVSVVEASDLSAAEARAYGLADNQTALLAEWDDSLLTELLAGARNDGLLETTGFTGEDMDRLLKPDLPMLEGDAEVETDDEEANLELTAEGRRLMALLRPAALKAPFPWFGGKRRVAGIVWAALGNPRLYVEPFAGSLAVLLSRPAEHFAADEAARHEHVNDLDGYVANFWRATAADPDAVALAADWPVNEADLLARHRWLVREGRRLIERLRDDPAAYDAQVAGWWVWGLSSWIAGGWCAGGLKGQRPHLGSTQGVTSGLWRFDTEQGTREALLARFQALRDRLRRVRVCCGEWSRVLTLGATCEAGDEPGALGVFLDPPYLPELRAGGCYTHDGSGNLTAAVRSRALELGAQSNTRVVIAGYAEEHGAEFRSAGWREVAWASKGGYKNRATSATTASERNRWKERLWFSPACLPMP